MAVCISVERSEIIAELKWFNENSTSGVVEPFLLCWSIGIRYQKVNSGKSCSQLDIEKDQREGGVTHQQCLLEEGDHRREKQSVSQQTFESIYNTDRYFP